MSERNVSDTCTEIHMALRAHSEYRQLFADRVQRHFFNEGALTFGRTSEVLDLHAGFIDRAIVGESARWGGLLRPDNPYDRTFLSPARGSTRVRGAAPPTIKRRPTEPTWQSDQLPRLLFDEF